MSEPVTKDLLPRIRTNIDDRGNHYLCVADPNETTVIRIALIGDHDEVGRGRFSHLVQDPQEHEVALDLAPLPTYFQSVGDWVQDEVIEWLSENVSFAWSLECNRMESSIYHTAEDQFLTVSFANSADAVAFKLRWADRAHAS